MPPNQLVAIVLAVLAIGAGAVGAAQVTDGPPNVTPPPWANNDDAERNLNLSVAGNVTPGETVTLTATLHGEPAPHAPVEVNGEAVGETDAQGQLGVTVPDEDEFEVEIEPEYEGETTVPLAEDEADEEDEIEADDENDERPIDLAIDGNVTPNETVTVTATVNGTPLANAEISVDGEAVGTTAANGSIEVTVPKDADEFEVEAEYEPTGTLTVELEDDEADAADDEREFDVAVDGTVSAGETVTVTATHNGTPVENATVEVNDETVGTTDADGQLDVTLPDDADEVEIAVETDDGEGEWEHEFEDGEDEDADEDDEDEGGDTDEEN